ncbi:MAG: hypothetical protein QGG82_02825 [Patescibacteria group bacterium]|nr:hypothetical protein [Patescibacteria group bacterium]|tara:strand:+ start:1442 stop:1564 length:123 start_codon:yes stop_codon:yes gene_type:complete
MSKPTYQEQHKTPKTIKGYYCALQDPAVLWPMPVIVGGRN